MLNCVEIDLITTYEEVLALPKEQCITEYYGDLSIHSIKQNVSQETINQRLEDALNIINLTRDEFNSLVEKEKFVSRARIVKYVKRHLKQ